MAGFRDKLIHHHERRVELVSRVSIQASKGGRHHANDREHDAVDPHGAAQDGGIPTELLLPEEHGRTMWVRVKGKTENALLRLPFKAAFMFRPGNIQPLRGIRSNTRWYQALYDVMGPLYPILRRLFPRYVTTTVNIGRAMIHVAATGSSKQIRSSADINQLSG